MKQLQTKQNITKAKNKATRQLGFWFMIEQDIYKMTHASEEVSILFIED